MGIYSDIQFTSATNSEGEATDYTSFITLNKAKEYLRLGSSYNGDNVFITDCINAACNQVLKDTLTVLLPMTVQEYFENYGLYDCLDLQYLGVFNVTTADPPVIDVTVKYYDNSNILTIMTKDVDYRAYMYTGKLKIEFIKTPNLHTRKYPILVDYKVKPKDDNSIKPLFIAAMMLIQHFYDNRGIVTYGKVEEFPMSYNDIIANYKNYTF